MGATGAELDRSRELCSSVQLMPQPHGTGRVRVCCCNMWVPPGVSLALSSGIAAANWQLTQLAIGS